MKIFLFAHAGGNVWEYKNLFAELQDIADFIPVELPADACTIAQEGFRNFEEYISFSCDIIKKNASMNEKIILFGHSFGGYLVHEIAAEIPDYVDGVIASCCHPYHIYNAPDKKDSTYLELFGYSDNMPKELMELFEPLVADKIEVVKKYCESFKNCDKSRKLSVPSHIIYADKDDKECGSEEWYEYYSKEKCAMTKMNGGHFYWRDSEENIPKLIDIMRNMIRSVKNE